MVKLMTGNLLEADVEALVNSVNTVGIMGKGVALQFRQAFRKTSRHIKKPANSTKFSLGRCWSWPLGHSLIRGT